MIDIARSSDPAAKDLAALPSSPRLPAEVFRSGWPVSWAAPFSSAQSVIGKRHILLDLERRRWKPNHLLHRVWLRRRRNHRLFRHFQPPRPGEFAGLP